MWNKQLKTRITSNLFKLNHNHNRSKYKVHCWRQWKQSRVQLGHAWVWLILEEIVHRGFNLRELFASLPGILGLSKASLRPSRAWLVIKMVSLMLKIQVLCHPLQFSLNLWWIGTLLRTSVYRLILILIVHKMREWRRVGVNQIFRKDTIVTIHEEIVQHRDKEQVVHYHSLLTSPSSLLARSFYLRIWHGNHLRLQPRGMESWEDMQPTLIKVL